MILTDMSEKIIQYIVGLVFSKLIDPFSEALIDK